MKVISAEFVTSAALRLAPGERGGLAQGRPLRLAPGEREGLSEIEGLPHDGLPHVAMAGRSNVGKSTLINALARRPIARTSAAPGKTRLANVYRLTIEGHGPGRWSLYLVDLPGYGYARGGRSSAEELRAVAEGYLRAKVPVPGAHIEPGTGTLLTLLLIDARHPGLESDIQAHAWLTTFGVEPLIVATKVDKLSRAERTRNLREVERIFGKPALPVSAERGEGMDELWKTIASKARAAERSLRAADV